MGTAGQVLAVNSGATALEFVTPIALTDLSVTQNAAGTAGLSYDNTTGAFTYTPPDLSSYLTSYTVTASDLGSISIDALSDVDTTTLQHQLVVKSLNGMEVHGHQQMMLKDLVVVEALL